jgi:Fe-S oxidoreductase
MTARADLCTHCPKLCSFTCPVAEVSAREALTPWGKVSLAALSPATSALELAGCTGCDRCVQFCEHHNEVPSILYEARAQAVRAGAAPKAWTDLQLRFATLGHGRAEDLAAARASLPETLPGSSSAQLFPGCDLRSDLVGDALFAAAKLGAPLELTPPGALCCGRELREGGHPELAQAHGARVRNLIGRKPLVFLNPACANHVVQSWPEVRAEHITTWLSRALAALPREKRPPPREDILYKLHDPCALERGLCEKTAPRALLAAACGDFREPGRSSCCGAEGLLPRTLPDLAKKIADDRKLELGEPIATASPACAAALGATDVVTIVARWLDL